MAENPSNKSIIWQENLPKSICMVLAQPGIISLQCRLQNGKCSVLQMLMQVSSDLGCHANVMDTMK